MRWLLLLRCSRRCSITVIARAQRRLHPKRQSRPGRNRGLRGEERTNYPLTLSVDDLGEDFGLAAQTPASIGPMRVCEFMRTALEELVEAPGDGSGYCSAYA